MSTKCLRHFYFCHQDIFHQHTSLRVVHKVYVHIHIIAVWWWYSTSIGGHTQCAVWLAKCEKTLSSTRPSAYQTQTQPGGNIHIEDCDGTMGLSIPPLTQCLYALSGRIMFNIMHIPDDMKKTHVISRAVFKVLMTSCWCARSGNASLSLLRLKCAYHRRWGSAWPLHKCKETDGWL